MMKNATELQKQKNLSTKIIVTINLLLKIQFTKPLNEFRELSLINYFTEPHLHVNPQKHIQKFEDRNGTFSRKLARDQYTAPEQKD